METLSKCYQSMLAIW